MNSRRNELALVILRKLQMAEEPQLLAAIQVEGDGDSRIEDQLAAKGILSLEAHVALSQVLEAVISAHSGVNSALNALTTVKAGDESTLDRHELSATATLEADSRMTDYDLKQRDDSHPRFRILSEHARGGLGLVSAAFDEELNREVALKEMQSRFTADAESRRRFVTEAEITGQLEHPGVVPVYSLGWNQQGHPYYAMRFIRGESLKETVDRFHFGHPLKEHEASKSNESTVDFQSVEFRKLLGRVVDVCHAVEYAHSRNVLHRDLKPSNVMLGPYGETLVVDWGLAKVQAESESSSSAKRSETIVKSNPVEATQFGVVMGTPRFMPPEQAAGDIDNLGPTADIYSIGAMLFYVLTGTYSVDADDAQNLLSRVVAGKIRLATEVNDAVPRPLEAICRKAMAHAPQDRYQRANEIGDELERWLADEPVQVHRDSLVVRARRWVRKHQTLATSLAASLTVAFAGLLAGLLVFANLNSRLEAANGELLAANELESSLRIQAQESEAKAVARKQDADENFQLAVEAVEKYLTRIDDDVELAQNSFFDLRARLLRTAIPFFEKFIAKRGQDELLDSFHGSAYYRLAVIQAELGKHELAIEYYGKAQEIFQALIDNELDVERSVEWLARTHNNLGNLLKKLGSPDKAFREHVKGRDLLAKLVKEHPKNTDYLNGLAQSLHNLGVMASDKADYTAAERILKEAIEIERGLLAIAPEDPFYRLLAAKSGNSLAVNRFRQQQIPAAVKAYESALKDSDLPSVEDNRGLERRGIRSAIYHNLGVVKMQMGQSEKAKENYNASLAISEKLIKEAYRVPTFRNQFAATHTNLGNLYRDMGETKLAERHQQTALKAMEDLVDDFPRVPAYRLQYGGTLCNQGNAISEKDPNAAIKRYDQSIAVLSPLVKEEGAKVSDVNTARLFLRNGFWAKAQALENLGSYVLASEAFLNASRLADKSLGQSLKANAAYSLAQVGNAKEVTRIGRELLDLERANPFALVKCAKASAVVATGTDDPEAKNQLVQLAIQLLTAAEKLGHFRNAQRAAELQSNADLESIRELPEFEELRKRVGH